MLRPEGDVKILDIGTGSGAIIVSLLDYLPQAKGVGVDISVDALIVAKENSEKIGRLAKKAGIYGLFRQKPPELRIF